MTEMLDVLLKNPDSVAVLAGRPAVLLLRPILVLTTSKADQWDPVRHWPGDWPTNFLNARLNAASDS